MKIKKQLTAPEIEKKVLNYITNKTSMGYTIDFNPLDVSIDGIADGLNLKIEEVEEGWSKIDIEYSER